MQEDLPDHVWKPREMELIDTQAMPRHARERGVEPPVNIAQVLLSRDGRTVTLVFAPPRAPAVRVHDALGERDVPIEMEHAYAGGPDDRCWTVEARVAWRHLGFEPPRSGDDWALNVYRDIRFFSNWSFIAWMRDWGKAEYSRFDLTERFGRIWFAEATPAVDAVERRAAALALRHGPVRVFTPNALLLVEPGGAVVRQRYAERAAILRAYAEGLRRERQRIGNDLPYHPFFSEKKPREHLAVAGRKLARLYEAMNERPLLDDPASTVARISHAIPEARDGLYTYKKERLYRGLPE